MRVYCYSYYHWFIKFQILLNYFNVVRSRVYKHVHTISFLKMATKYFSILSLWRVVWDEGQVKMLKSVLYFSCYFLLFLLFPYPLWWAGWVEILRIVEPSLYWASPKLYKCCLSLVGNPYFLWFVAEEPIIRFLWSRKSFTSSLKGRFAHNNM